jgi:hypothetical protein
MYSRRENIDVTKKAVYRYEIGRESIEWSFEPYGGGILVDLRVMGKESLGICRIDSAVFELDAPQKTDRVIFLGRGIYENEMRYPSELAAEEEYNSDCVGLSKSLTDKGVLLAGVSPFVNICKAVALKRSDGGFELSAKTEFGDSMKDEKCLAAERVYFSLHRTIDGLLDDYRALIPQSSFDMPKLKGWNTWDYYLDRVTPEDIDENIETLKGMPFANEIDYIVIDDGWQADWGDWRENEKFSCGLKTVADNIKNAGFIPGIWMAPLSVKKDSHWLSEHPEWFCRTADGELLLDMGLYYMDPTHPDAERFILENYKYQYEAGYRLFKMDYISPLLKVKRFCDENATPYGVLSRLVERVKETTGPDAVILGCSLPLECGADIAPAMRMSVDIHNHFSHVVWIAQSLVWSWMYNLKNTRIDPDFLVVRGEETADEPLIWEGGKRNDFVAPPRHKQTDKDRWKSHWRHGDQFNAVEAETWANLVAISGGNIFLSDRMSVLNEKGISIINNAFALAGDSVRPRYLEDDVRLPSVWLGDRGLIIINWDEIPRTISVSGIDGELEAHKCYVLENGELTVSLLPHESFGAVYKNK